MVLALVFLSFCTGFSISRKEQTNEFPQLSNSIDEGPETEEQANRRRVFRMTKARVYAKSFSADSLFRFVKGEPILIGKVNKKTKLPDTNFELHLPNKTYYAQVDLSGRLPVYESLYLRTNVEAMVQGSRDEERTLASFLGRIKWYKRPETVLYGALLLLHALHVPWDRVNNVVEVECYRPLKNQMMKIRLNNTEELSFEVRDLQQRLKNKTFLKGLLLHFFFIYSIISVHLFNSRKLQVNSPQYYRKFDDLLYTFGKKAEEFKKIILGLRVWVRNKLRQIFCTGVFYLINRLKALKDYISKYKSAHRRIFNAILEKINVSNKEKCRSVVNRILPEIIERMRLADPLFGRMYKELVHTRSFYEKLRINNANEFDINIVLKLPTNMDLIKVDWARQPPTYAFVQIDETVEDMELEEDEENRFRNFMDEYGYLEPQAVLNWLQSVMDRADLTTMDLENIVQIRCSASGPAKTLKFRLDDDTLISLDLVPVFKFSYEDWPKDLKNYQKDIVDRIPLTKRNLYLVPKVYKTSHTQCPHEPAQVTINCIWRLHFADMEREYLNSQPGTKPVIKLLKQLRDSQNWTFCHSYFLKVLVLKEICKNPEKKWERINLANDVLEILEKLQECLEKRFLPHFFFATVNLFQSLTEVQLRNMTYRLGDILENIKDNPDTIKKYFVV